MMPISRLNMMKVSNHKSKKLKRETFTETLGIFEDNPWDVNKLDDFLYFCCPECDVKCEERKAFIEHAQTRHPLASGLLRREKLWSILHEDEEDPLKIATFTEEIDLPTLNNLGKLTLKFDVEEVYYSNGDDVKKISEINPVEAVTCYLCDEVMTRPDLTIHFLSKHRNKSFLGRPMKSTLGRPVKQSNCFGVDSEVQCYNCGEMMVQRDMKAHMINEHGNSNQKRYGKPRNHQCLDCRKMFESASELNLHLCTVTYNATMPLIKDQNECPLCCEKMKFDGSLRTHIIKTHGTNKKFKCATCGYESTNFGDHSHHVAVNHMLKSFLCAGCPELTFETKDELQKHERKKHPQVPKRRTVLDTPLICEHCGKKFFTRDKMVIHIKELHTRSDTLKMCDNCQGMFSTAEELNTHSFLCLDSPLAAKCKYCSENDSTVWYSSTALEKHALDEHNHSCYVCNICGKMFAHRIKHDRHKKHIHEGVKFEICNVCDKSFEFKTTLNYHMKYVHLRDETFECEFCSYSCNVKHNFTKHVKVMHKLFMCNKCLNRYDTEELLNEHINLEHSSNANN